MNLEGEELFLYTTSLDPAYDDNQDEENQDDGNQGEFFDVEADELSADGRSALAEDENLLPLAMDNDPLAIEPVIRPASILGRRQSYDYDPRPWEERRLATPPPTSRSSASIYPLSSSLSDLFSASPETRFKLPRKSHTADVATTRVDVHATTDADLGGYDARGLPTIDEKQPILTTQTIISQSGCYDMTWEEQASASSSESLEPLSIASGRRKSGAIKQLHSAGPDSPMERVKSKLAAWSRSKEKNAWRFSWQGSARATADTSPDAAPSDEETRVPPNTRKSSAAVSRSRSRGDTSQGYTRSYSPFTMEEEEDEDTDSPHSSARTSPLPIAFHSLARGNAHHSLSARDRFLATHRDSVELAQQRLLQPSDPDSHEIPSLQLPSRDSIVIAQRRFEKYPKSPVILDPQTGQIKFGGLSPIMDASPPDPRAHFAAFERQKLRREREGGVRETAEVGGHAANDHECPICAIERPREIKIEKEIGEGGW